MEKNAYDRHLERISAYVSFYGSRALEDTIRMAKRRRIVTEVDVSFFYISLLDSQSTDSKHNLYKGTQGGF